MYSQNCKHVDANFLLIQDLFNEISNSENKASLEDLSCHIKSIFDFFKYEQNQLLNCIALDLHESTDFNIDQEFIRNLNNTYSRNIDIMQKIRKLYNYIF